MFHRFLAILSLSAAISPAAFALDCNAVGWAMADSLCDDANPGSCAATCDAGNYVGSGDTIDYTCNDTPQVQSAQIEVAVQLYDAKGRPMHAPGRGPVISLAK